MTVGDPSRVDRRMAGTPPPVILRHDRGLRRGEAAGFNTRRKASGADMRACPPATDGQPSATMTIISPLQLVPPHASKTNGNSDSSPFTPDNIHHKRKKDQDLRPSFFSPHTRQGSSLRSHPCPLKRPTAKAVAGGVQAVVCTIHHDDRPTIAFWEKDQGLRPRCLYHRAGRVARCARTPAL